MTELRELRARHTALAKAMLPEYVARLSWDATTLAEHRGEALRALLKVAAERSAWHRERLAGLRLDAVGPEDLTALPTMTKRDVMTHFDRLVIDPRLTLRAVEDLLAAGAGGYLFDEYSAAATAGSTGGRTVMLYDRLSLAVWWLSVMRPLLAWRSRQPDLDGRPLVVCYVSAAHSSHITALLATTFSDPDIRNVSVPVTLPIATIVERLNEAQPETSWPTRRLGVVGPRGRRGSAAHRSAPGLLRGRTPAVRDPPGYRRPLAGTAVQRMGQHRGLLVHPAVRARVHPPRRRPHDPRARRCGRQPGPSRDRSDAPSGHSAHGSHRGRPARTRSPGRGRRDAGASGVHGEASALCAVGGAVMTAGPYCYAHAGAPFELEVTRLRLLEGRYDELSARRLLVAGDLTGARCLEVGAGAGSVARMLSAAVCPGGWLIVEDADYGSFRVRLPRLVEDLGLEARGGETVELADSVNVAAWGRRPVAQYLGRACPRGRSASPCSSASARWRPT